MARYALTYITTLLAFGLIDSVWLTLFAGPLYKQTLGPMLLENFRAPPAILFYLLQIGGMMVFVVPATAGGQTIAQNFLFGALFGLFTYATLDLTCYAIIRPWTLYLTVTDIAWGVFLTGAASVIGIWAGDWLLRRLT
jgi:uncharacterized membrane protein